jgi:hypothetical protein
MTPRPVVAALLAAGLALSSLGGCSCVRLLPSETIARSLAGPSVEDVTAGRGAVGDDVAWAGVLRGAEEGLWTFDALDVPEEARVRGLIGSATDFVDARRVVQTGRTFQVRCERCDPYGLVQPGRTYVVYAVLATTDRPVVEIPAREFGARVLELRVREPLPALDRLGFVRGQWETRDASKSKWLPAVVFLPESSAASAQAIAAYVESALGADASSRAVLGVDDSPAEWSGYRIVFHRMTRDADVPLVVIDAKGGRRAEIAGLGDPTSLRKAVELATRKAGAR